MADQSEAIRDSMSDLRHIGRRGVSLIEGGNLPDVTLLEKVERLILKPADSSKSQASWAFTKRVLAMVPVSVSVMGSFQRKVGNPIPPIKVSKKV
jgi:hypothetical protein